MRYGYKPLIASICLVLLLYFVLYYEVIESAAYSPRRVDPSNSLPISKTLSPHMQAASKSDYLPRIPCGTGWQEEYAELHRKALREDGRVLVSIYVEGGIADNLSGLMSEFYLALLSNRALQIYEYGFLPKYESAFRPAYFNWSNPGYPDLLTDNLKYTYHGLRGWQGSRSYFK